MLFWRITKLKKNNKKKVVIKDYYANQNKNRKREVNKVRI